MDPSGEFRGRRRIVINAVAVAGGGGQTYLVNILQALCAAEPLHEYIVVLTPRQRSLAGLLPPAVHVEECAGVPEPAWLRVLWEQAALPRLLRRWRPDLLFAAFNTAVLRSPVPIVLVAHSVNAYSRLDIRWPAYMTVRHAGLRALGRLSGRVAGAVVFVSETSARFMGPRMKVPAVRRRVVHYGWRSPPDDAGPAAARFPGLPGRYILTVGDLLEHKNVDVLLQAFARLVADHGYAGDLVVVGGTPKGAAGYVGALMAKRERLPCRQRVRFLGGVSNAVMPDVYRAAEVFVLPSLEETFGLPLVEAMGAGIPVVVTDWRLNPEGEQGRTNVGPEICGTAGEFFDPMSSASLVQALARVLSDPVRRDAMVRDGRARARTFSWDRAARLLLDIFEEVAARG